MNTTKNAENQTKKLLLQKVVDACVIVLLSITILSVYENYWTTVHTSKENIFAIHFDMFSTYYSFVFILFIVIVPNLIEFISDRKILHKNTDKKQNTTKLVRFLKIIIITFFVVLLSVIFTDKYSRVEFYNNGRIIEYNRQNQIANEYNKSDIESVELRINHSSGRGVTYWTEAIFHLYDNSFLLQEKDYIAPDNYEFNYNTARSLYGLKKIKKIFSDKIKINTENIDILLQVEWVNYTQQQAKELCEVFELDYDSIATWLKEEWDIVFKE